MDNSKLISLWVVAALVCGVFFVLDRRAEGGTGETAPYTAPAKKALKAKLTPQQYSCTQEDGTEPPFANAYWNNHADGIYVDVVSGDPLFSSLDKFDSGTGWPSFTQPLGDSVQEKQDKTLGMQRTEVRSKRANSHLGHVFDDGPGPQGMRYCINSAALRFVPLADLEKNGLGAYRFLFAEKLGLQTVTLAGGCFWGMEEMFQKFPGVVNTRVGYAGGKADLATYEQVSTGRTGHAEALQIMFDPHKTSLDKLLTHFFSIHDPTTRDRQANDVGTQYRSAIFYANDAQKAAALTMIKRVNASHKWANPVVTRLEPLTSFVQAEAYHQRYLENHPGGYTCHVDRHYDF